MPEVRRFDRWKPSRRQTLAYKIFEAHHESLNNMYWAHEAALSGAFASTKGHQKTDRSALVFPNKGGRRRREISLETWSKDYNGFDNWTRLSAIIAACGYLEMYIKSVVEAACQSCPSVLVGGHREIEGMKLRMNRPKYSFFQYSERCATGTWDQRIKNYASIFGSCPVDVRNRVADLERLRILRNSVGHSFGRRLSKPHIGRDVVATSFQTVKHEALLKAMELVNVVAKAVEDDLGDKYVGSYETLCMYHLWSGRKSNTKPECLSFCKYFNTTTGAVFGTPAFRGLLTYYHGL